MSIPISFAQPFAPGDVPAGNYIQLRTKAGVDIPTQQDQESTWRQDGSLKCAAISASLSDSLAGIVGIVPGSLSWNNGTVSLTTSTPHGLSNGQLAYINGVFPAAYENYGAPVTVTVTGGANSTTLSYPLASNPGTASFISSGATIGPVIEYDIYSVAGTPNRAPNATLAQLAASSDLKLLFTGYDLGSDTWEASVNDIIANGSGAAWPYYAGGPNSGAGWGTNPMRGWEVVRSGPVCTEWRFWTVLRRVSDGAFHPWLRAVLFVRAWGASGPYEIGGYWLMPNIWGPNTAPAPAGTISTNNATDLLLAGYRFGGNTTPTAGSGWTALQGANNQLLEYHNVTTTQSNLTPPIGVGNNNQNGGIGDAIMNGAVDTNANASVHGYSTTTSVTLPGISTNGPNRVVVVFAYSNGGAVTGVSAPGLTFTQRHQYSISGSGTTEYSSEWYAVAASQLSNVAITVTSNASGPYPYTGADAVAVSGANTASESTIFDSNAALPAELVSGASVSGGTETHLCFTATLQNGNTVLEYYGGPNDFRTAATAGANAIPLGGGTVSLGYNFAYTSVAAFHITQQQYETLFGVTANAYTYGGYSTQSGWWGGGIPVVLSASGSMPPGLNAGQVYWLTGLDGQSLVTFALDNASSQNAGGSTINNFPSVSGTGAGSLTITPLAACFPAAANAVLGADSRRIWVGGAAPTLLVDPDFSYLTTKARMLPPYIPAAGNSVDQPIVIDANVSAASPPVFSQTSVFNPWNPGGTGDNTLCDRIGWLTHHSACELYRPYDNVLHQTNLCIAASYFNYGYWVHNEQTALFPVINQTTYPNLGTSVGPNFRWGWGQGYTVSVSGAAADLVGGDTSGSHQFCPWIMPYLKTGDLLWYEGMANFLSERMASAYAGTQTIGSVTAYKCPYQITPKPLFSDPDDGIQVRGMGWIMRIEGLALHTMPDTRPEAPYFRDQHHSYIQFFNVQNQQPGYDNNIGFLEGNQASNGSYFQINAYMHDYAYLGWAVEAWKNEYPEALQLFTNFFYRYCPKRTDTSDPTNPGSIWPINNYQYIVGDPAGNWPTSWEQMYEWTAANSGTVAGCDAIVDLTAGSPTVTIVSSSLFGVAANYTMANTSTADFAGTPMVTTVNGNQVTLGAYYGEGTTPVSGRTASAFTAQLSQAAAAGATTLTFASFPNGTPAVGMGVVDQSNMSAIPIGGWNQGNLTTYVTAVNGTTVTLSYPVGTFTGSGAAAGDTILFGPVMWFTPGGPSAPWPGMATINSTFPYTDLISNISGGEQYSRPDSYTTTYTCALALADILYQISGDAKFASAATAYKEIRRRQYLTTLSDGKTPAPWGALSFANGPKYAIGLATTGGGGGSSLPAAPAMLAAADDCTSGVSLSWAANAPSDNVTGYKVYRAAQGSGNAGLVATVTSPAYTDTDSALASGTNWSYYVVAQNTAGTSPASGTVVAQIP
jgi:hypothetical protein